MKKNNLKVVIILLLSLLSLIAGCISTEKKIDQQPIKIAFNLWPGYAYTFIAQEKGFFEKNGVKVELVYKQDYIQSQNAYLNGDVDGVWEVFSDTIFHNAEGLSSKVVYIADYSDSGDVIIGKKEFKSLKDLKGKKISVEGINSFSHLFVLAALEQAGLKENEIQFENIPAHQVLEALENGKIDAGHTWEPTKSAAIKKGYPQLGKAGDIPGIITDVLVFNPKTINKRPEEIKAIIKSLIQAKDFQDNNPEEAIKIMAEKEGIGIEEMASGLKGVHQLNIEENLEAMKYNGYLYTSSKTITNFYLNRGQMSKNPNLSMIIEPKFLNEINGR